MVVWGGGVNDEPTESPITILFTDVVGSTDLRTVRGDRVAQELLGSHEVLVRQKVEAHGGREVKALGDGFMVAFASARRALACAVAIQQALEDHNRLHPDQAIRVRVGLNSGEVLEQSGDLGAAVNAAALIAAKAQGGEILAAEVVQHLAGPGCDFAFRDRGRFRLEGFPEGWRLCEVLWQESGADIRERGRGAVRRHAWQEAFDLLSRADAAPSLNGEDLEALGDAADSVGRDEDGRAARERAYTMHLEAGERRRAARVAWRLFYDYARMGRRAIAGGWLGRAKRLLEGQADCPEQGLLLLVEAEAAHGAGDLVAAAEKAERAVEYGRRFGDRDLEALGTQALGRILIDRAEISEGLARLDEAMLAAARGELGPDATGWIYCSVIAACHQLGDLQRAAEWTAALSQWCEEKPFSVYPGLCRVHRAQILELGGAWAQAEEEARRACEAGPEAARGGRYEIGEIRRRLGDLEGAEDAFRRADELGHDPQPGLALLRLAQGRVEAAAAAIRRALAAESGNRLARAKLLPAQVQIALADGDLQAAQAAADELAEIAEQYGSSGLRAAAFTACGRLQLAQQDAASASRSLRQALRQWQELHIPYEVATTRLLLGLACRTAGDEEAAASSFQAAAAIFEELGAAVDARRSVELRGGKEATNVAGGLTKREAEVLRLVAAGKTNKDIAAELYLSPRTVAHHLDSIFTKLGVSSRAAATAYAYEHGLAGPSSPSQPR
jgi:class 3 adenylate cyclase/DNA-binding NarL/FixJ family response regulator